MSINWLWSEKCGEATYEYEVDGEKNELTLSLYEGNCWLIFINEYQEDGVDKYSLWSFWADKEHMKRMLGLDAKGGYTDNDYDNGFGKITKIRLNKKKNRHWKDIVKAVSEVFDSINIEIYTEG